VLKQFTFVFCGLLFAQGASAADVVREAPVKTIQPYGFMRLDAIYNDSRFNHPHYPNYVLLTDSPQNEQHLHPRLSRLGIDIKSGAVEGISGLKLSGKLEIDFQNGGSESRQLIRMRHAYGEATLGSFSLLFGQSWQVASRLYPMANADSMMWGAGNAGDRSPQLRMTFQTGIGEFATITTEAAAMMPNSIDKKDVDGDKLLDGANAGVPAFQGRVAASIKGWTNAPIHLAAALHSSQDKVEGDKTYDSQGVFAEFSLPLITNYTLRGEWFTGKNLSDVRAGIGQGVRSGNEINTTGFWGEFVAAPTPWLKLATGYGQDDPARKDLVPTADAPARVLNTATWAVAQVRPADDFRVGLEYLRYETTWQADVKTKMQANRFNAHFTYFF
jgi:hypothetical protein